MAPRYSITIPLHRDGPAFRKALTECLALDHSSFEILVVSDRPVDMPDDARVRFVLTGTEGNSGPAEKRDVALAQTRGEIIAYLDDDAYPPADWLNRADDVFADPDVRALGGPGVTPPESDVRARAGGAVYESLLGSGPLQYRFTPREARVVDDYPAYNFFVRTDAMKAVGGWRSTFYGGEDTFVCEALRDNGVMVHYRPEVLVYHHRRAVFGPHMRQIGNVGLHRGHFARSAGTSRRVSYFLPLTVVTGGLAAMLLLAARRPRAAVAAAAAYAVGTGAASPDRDRRVRALYPFALAAHHIAYAWGFARGLATRRLDR